MLLLIRHYHKVCLCFYPVKQALICQEIVFFFFKSFWNQGTEMFSRGGLLPSRQWELGRCISTGSSLWLICLLSGLSRRCIFSDLYLNLIPPAYFLCPLQVFLPLWASGPSGGSTWSLLGSLQLHCRPQILSSQPLWCHLRPAGAVCPWGGPPRQ